MPIAMPAQDLMALWTNENPRDRRVRPAPQIPETAPSFLAARSELAPAFFPDVDSIMRPRRLDIREGEFAIGVSDALDLIEAGKRVSHMARICERLLALPGKGVDAFRQIAARGQIAVLRVGLPSGLCGHLLLLHCPFVVFRAAPQFTPIFRNP